MAAFPTPKDRTNLWRGPTVDNLPTWFCFGRDIPAGWERRNTDRTDTTKWWSGSDPYGPDIYQVRPMVEPDPEVTVQRLVVTHKVKRSQIREIFNGRPPGSVDQATDKVWALLTGEDD